MKVLLLSDANSIHTRRWVEGLIARNIQVALYSLGKPEGDFYSRFSEAQLTLQSASIGLKSNLLSKMVYLKAIPAIRTLIKDFAPDIVHAHYATSYGLLGAMSGFKPFVISVWGSDVYDFPDASAFHRLIIKKILASATRIASTSECMAQKVQSLVAPGTQVDVTPFGVDETKFSPVGKEPVTDTSIITIGTVKTMDHKYGIDTLIEAFAMCTRQLTALGVEPNTNIRLLIAGGGPDLLALKMLAQREGIGDVTTFTGSIPHEEVPQVLARMDVFVALSRLDSESFGVAAIEAGAMALPTVVSDAGGLPEVVIHRKTGLVVPRDNPRAAANALLELIENAEIRRTLGQAAREHVLQLYAQSHCIDIMLTLYETVLNDASKA